MIIAAVHQNIFKKLYLQSIFKLSYFHIFKLTARVAKLVDALCSGRSVRKDVLVRIQSRAQKLNINAYKLIIYKHFIILKDTLPNILESNFNVPGFARAGKLNSCRYPGRSFFYGQIKKIIR